jgi:hypothetical protein
VPSGCDEELLLQPSDIWTVERLEPRQLKELWRKIVDLIDEKESKN